MILLADIIGDILYAVYIIFWTINIVAVIGVFGYYLWKIYKVFIRPLFTGEKYDSIQEYYKEIERNKNEGSNREIGYFKVSRIVFVLIYIASITVFIYLLSFTGLPKDYYISGGFIMGVILCVFMFRYK